MDEYGAPMTASAAVCPVCSRQTFALFIPYWDDREGACEGCYYWALTYFTALVRFFADRSIQ